MLCIVINETSQQYYQVANYSSNMLEIPALSYMILYKTVRDPSALY